MLIQSTLIQSKQNASMFQPKSTVAPRRGCHGTAFITRGKLQLSSYVPVFIHSVLQKTPRIVCASSLFPCFITFHMLTVRLSQPRLFSSRRGGARRYAPFRPRSGKIIWTVAHFCLPQQSHSSASVRRTPVRIFP